MSAGGDRAFAGSIPKMYQSHLVPLIFEPYADDLARRLAALHPARVLEIAAGTGVVTRAIDRALAAEATIVATDLNADMLEEARRIGTTRAVDWRPADAGKLPFPDASFDCVVCQFGVMFFPDKALAAAEARRVLAPGGLFLFNVWDRLEENEFPHVVDQTLASLFPQDPPRFLARTPYGYHDEAVIERDLAAGGLRGARIETVTARSVAPSAAQAATALCQGTPLRAEIEARGSLAAATEAATAAIAKRFGQGPVDGRIQAKIVAVERDRS
jgi:SAM-dependent methyltransferase